MKVWFLVIILTQYEGGVAVETLGPFATAPACAVAATMVKELFQDTLPPVRASKTRRDARCVPVDRPKETLQ